MTSYEFLESQFIRNSLISPYLFFLAVLIDDTVIESSSFAFL